MTRKSLKYSIALTKNDGIVSIYVFNNDKTRSLLTKNSIESIDIDYSILNDDSVDITNIPAEKLEYVLSILTNENTVVLHKCKHHSINRQIMKFIDKVFLI